MESKELELGRWAGGKEVSPWGLGVPIPLALEDQAR